jgi:ATP-dependent Clp protease protease subunit
MQKGGPRLGFEAEAFAIYDVMQFVKPPLRTMCVGSAFGEAALLLSAGDPGMRAALPSASIMLRQPIQRFQQMQASDIDIARNELRCASCDDFLGASCCLRICYMCYTSHRQAEHS